MERAHEPAAVFVVDVDDRGAGVFEQAPLGLEVVLHVLVEVEVVLGEVGEDPACEHDPLCPPERERVGGHLHDAGLVAGVEHAPERALEVDRLGRGALDGLLAPADHRGDRAKLAGWHVRGLEDRPRQEGGRRLPVRAGDAHHA